MVFVERSFSIFRLFSNSFLEQQSYSVPFFVSFFILIIFQGVRVVMFMEDTNYKQQPVHNVFPGSLSSRSSSGSTPGPTVTTPASPPSQPVSLPENNTLAQAISRALAESLPPLLSALREIQVAGTQTWP